jgi:hypothetical protein
MKKLFFAITLMLCSKLSFAQLANGNYTYSNNDITLKFSISNNGFAMSNIVVTNTILGKKYNGSGEWFQVNSKGVDQNYQGPFGWYQFSTVECNYDFDVLANELILNQFDCKDGSTSKKFKLTKK